jgi:rubrerythrin
MGGHPDPRARGSFLWAGAHSKALMEVSEDVDAFLRAQQEQPPALSAGYLREIKVLTERSPGTISRQDAEPVVYVCTECGWEEDEKFVRCPACGQGFGAPDAG